MSDAYEYQAKLYEIEQISSALNDLSEAVACGMENQLSNARKQAEYDCSVPLEAIEKEYMIASQAADVLRECAEKLSTILDKPAFRLGINKLGDKMYS